MKKRLLVLLLLVLPLVHGADDILIKNLGLTGFEETNPEYTSIRTVYLDLNFSAGSDGCRYINHDDPTSLPADADPDWTFWETCVGTRAWELSQNSGLKTVYYQINYSGTSVTLNDTIFYNHTGAGLDITPPNPPYIVDGDYTNDNTTIAIEWKNASDPESDILGIPLKFHYILHKKSTFVNDSSLMFYMPFDYKHNDSFTKDHSGNENHGELIDADGGNADGDTPPKWKRTGGKFQSAYDFDGIDDYLSISSDPALIPSGNSITLETWAKFDGNIVADSKPISGTSGNEGYTLRIDNDDANNLEVYIGDGSSYHYCTVAHSMNPETWYHLAATYDGSDFFLYINGSQIGTCPDSFIPSWGTVSLALNPIYNGSIDETRIYDRALSPAEINQNYVDGLRQLDTIVTTQESRTSTGLELQHNSSVYVTLITINSASLTSVSRSDGLTIDLSPPNMDVVYASFTNKSSGSIQAVPGDEDEWVYATKVNMSWNGSDVLSNNISGYSYVLSRDTTKRPDNIPEGDISDLAGHSSNTFSNLGTGKYYFLVKARDIAGNWGEFISINFSLDNSAPSIPTIVSETKTGGNITVVWSASSDGQSGVNSYMVNLSQGGIVLQSNKTVTQQFTYIDISSGDYNISVGARNGVGIWSWTGDEASNADFDPPTIQASPNSSTVASTTPLIRAFTDEQATCSYNTTNGQTQFVYSNDTYHETQLTTGTGAQSITITCSDASGNAGNATIGFVVTASSPDQIIMADQSMFEELLITIPVTVLQAPATYMAGLDASQFRLRLAGSNTNINAYDLGNGTYDISFVSPEAGSYSAQISYDGNPSTTATFTVKDMVLDTAYVDTGVSATNLNRISSYTDAYSKFGLAAQDENIVIQDQSNRLNITSDGTTVIFHTKNTNVNAKDNLLTNDDFFDKLNPAFGYVLDETHKLQFMLDPTEFNIKSQVGSEEKKGRQRFVVRKSSSVTGYPQVVFRYE